MTQKIRPSQFVLMYGPGAILEGENGPRMIPDAGIGLFRRASDFRPEDYRIDDQRMSKGLLGGAKIYRLPTNPELGHEGDIYRTEPFPLWKLCPRQAAHGGGFLLYRQDACPVCQIPAGGREAVRFVMACRDGHLDEIRWDFLVHGGSECGRSREKSVLPALRGDSIRWHPGSTLSEVRLECPRCGAVKKFGQIYYGEWRCGGRHPQRGGRDPGGCARKAKVIMRQAANLRLAETRTLLSVQPTGTGLHRCLQNDVISTTLLVRPDIDSKEKLLQMLEGTLEGKVSAEDVEEFRRADWDEIRQAVKDSGKDGPGTYGEMIMGEFAELLKASKHGAPPQTAKRPKSEVIFEVDPREKRTVRAQKTAFRIAPVQTLRTVTVQTGFRRDVPERGAADLPKLVDIRHREAGESWFPGVEFLGEGLFVCMDGGDGWAGPAGGAHAEAWSEGAGSAGSYPELVFRDAAMRQELSPGFVWWHTLSHLLIRTIGEEAGYSPASIRERVYFEPRGGMYRGGILLYAAQPGSEGTLGGLIGLVPHMGTILGAALKKAASCSGDPLCGEARFRGGGYNGASCYACLMTSETSCEHRNMWLDRHVLLDNPP